MWDPTTSVLGRFSNADSFIRTGQAPMFLKTHLSNETEDLQNSIREINISKKTAMPLKTSTHTHRQLLFLLQNSKLCHPRSPCQRCTMLSSLCQASAKGCYWGRDLPLRDRTGGAAMHKAYVGRESPFLFALLPGWGTTQSLGNGSESLVAATRCVEDWSLFPRLR